MIKLVCEECGHVWYTFNTRINQECCECGARLVEEADFVASKGIENISTMKFSGRGTF